MRADDETTAYQLHALLEAKGYSLSRFTILRCRTSLGWTFRGSSYCQLICQENKEKQLVWAKHYVNKATNGFENVVWTNECTVQLQTHRQFCCKRGERPRNKPRFVCVRACVCVLACVFACVCVCVCVCLRVCVACTVGVKKRSHSVYVERTLHAPALKKNGPETVKLRYGYIFKLAFFLTISF